MIAIREPLQLTDDHQVSINGIKSSPSDATKLVPSLPDFTRRGSKNADEQWRDNESRNADKGAREDSKTLNNDVAEVEIRRTRDGCRQK